MVSEVVPPHQADRTPDDAATFGPWGSFSQGPKVGEDSPSCLQGHCPLEGQCLLGNPVGKQKARSPGPLVGRCSEQAPTPLVSTPTTTLV